MSLPAILIVTIVLLLAFETASTSHQIRSPSPTDTYRPVGQQRQEQVSFKNAENSEHTSEGPCGGYSVSERFEQQFPAGQLSAESRGDNSCPSPVLPASGECRRRRNRHASARRHQLNLESKSSDAPSLRELLAGLPEKTPEVTKANSHGPEHCDANSTPLQDLTSDQRLEKLVSLIQVAIDTPRRATPQRRQPAPWSASNNSLCAELGDSTHSYHTPGSQGEGWEQEEADSEWSNYVLLKQVAGNRLQVYTDLANIPLESTTTEAESEQDGMNTEKLHAGREGAHWLHPSNNYRGHRKPDSCDTQLTQHPKVIQERSRHLFRPISSPIENSEEDQ